MRPDNRLLGRRFKRAGEVVSRDIAGETILVPVSGRLADMQRIFALNPAAEFIWRRLDGEKDLSVIRNEVLEQFDVGEEQAERDIKEFISELLKEELITEA